MSMVEASFNNDDLLGFVTGFGEGVNDLQCNIANMQMVASVDVSTHYFRKSIPIQMNENYKAGIVYIPDVHKVGAFLKSCKEQLTYIRHVGNTLTLTNGKNTFNTPTHTHILSNATVNRAESAIQEAKKNSWSNLGRAQLQCHGTLSSDEIRGLDSMTKVVGKDSPVRVVIDDGEMIITAGSQRGSKMSRNIEVDISVTSEYTETVFASHFPKLLNIMPSGDIIFHMGNKSALVLEHSDIQALLILKHQEGVE